MKRRRAFAGYEIRTPLDRNAKARLEVLAKIKRKTGEITQAAFNVLKELLWRFHNSKSGACYPTYKQLAAESGLCERTVGRAIAALERAKLITWTRCVMRERTTRSLINAANGYELKDPKGHSVLTTATATLNNNSMTPATAGEVDDCGLSAALHRLQRAITQGTRSNQ